MPESIGPLGIFGGTFDPVHYGHLRLAEEARQHLGLETVRWIPAGQPPHRTPPLSTPRQRLDMVASALAGHPAFELDTAEIHSTAPSYTLHTLERLRAELGADRPLVFLLGSDAFTHFSTWFRWQDILSLAHLGIAHRAGEAPNAEVLPPNLAAVFREHYASEAAALAQTPSGKIRTFAMTPLGISSTQIRQLRQQGESVRYLLPDSVVDYIDQHLLYSPSGLPWN